MSSIKKFFETNVLTRGIYARLYKIKHRKEKQAKRETLQTNGEKTISYLQTVFEKTGKTFFFDMGTLLGIIREGKLLSHDMDIDVGVLIDGEEDIEEIVKVLEENGCKRKYRYTVDGVGVAEDSFEYNDIKFDASYYYTDGGSNLVYLGYLFPGRIYESSEILSFVRLRTKKIEGVKKVEFARALINVPQNPEEYLAQRYGEKWRIPDKGFIYWKGPSAEKIDNLGRKIEIN